MNSVIMFEDDFCQIEIIDNIKDKKSDGEKNLLNAKISKEKFEKVMCNVLKKADHVIYDYDMSDSENDFAFVNERKNVILFYECNKTYISKIWLIMDIKSYDDYILTKNLLYELSNLGNLLIIDYGWEFCANLRETDRIDKYLKERVKVFNRK